MILKVSLIKHVQDQNGMDFCDRKHERKHSFEDLQSRGSIHVKVVMAQVGEAKGGNIFTPIS